MTDKLAISRVQVIMAMLQTGNINGASYNGNATNWQYQECKL